MLEKKRTQEVSKITSIHQRRMMVASLLFFVLVNAFNTSCANNVTSLQLMVSGFDKDISRMLKTTSFGDLTDDHLAKVDVDFDLISSTFTNPDYATFVLGLGNMTQLQVEKNRIVSDSEPFRLDYPNLHNNTSQQKIWRFIDSENSHWIAATNFHSAVDEEEVEKAICESFHDSEFVGWCANDVLGCIRFQKADLIVPIWSMPCRDPETSNDAVSFFDWFSQARRAILNF